MSVESTTSISKSERVDTNCANGLNNDKKKRASDNYEKQTEIGSYIKIKLNASAKFAKVNFKVLKVKSLLLSIHFSCQLYLYILLK